MQTDTRVAHILVVDDEPGLADTLTVILQRTGYSANAVYSGEEALAFITKQRPSLVISDVIMPGINGVVLAKKVRTACPGCSVILFSGNAETQELLEAASEDGHVFEVLAKPVLPRHLLEKVATLLSEPAVS